MRSEDSTLPPRKNLQFTGPGVTVVDNPTANSTDVTVTPLDSSSVVSSVFGRQGDVVALAGDYGADQISFDPSTSDLTSTNCQDAIVESYDELVFRLNEARLLFEVTNHAPGYTISVADLGKAFRGGSIGLADGGTFPVGSLIPLIRNSTSGMDVVATGSDVIVVAPFTEPSLRSNGSTATLWKVAEDTWILTGDLWSPTNALSGQLAPGSSVADGNTFNLTSLSSTGVTWSSTSDTFYPPRRGIYFLSLLARVGDPDLDSVIKISALDEANNIIAEASSVVRANGAQTEVNLTTLITVTNPGVDGVRFSNNSGESVTSDSNVNLNGFSIHRVGDLDSTAGA